jgi:hypothetical protein
MSARRSRCKTHCPTCHAHFSSNAAFDAHRKGPIGARYCAEPADLTSRAGVPVFGVKDLAGVCEIAGGGVHVGIVWALARSQGGPERFAGLREAA